MAVTRHDIVVIGASAGGLEALQSLLAPLDGRFPAALFLVSHLSPGHSVLDEVLAARTSLRVLFAEDGEAIRHGTLLVAPPDRHLILESGRAVLRRGPRENLWRPAIDVLFRSAAGGEANRSIVEASLWAAIRLLEQRANLDRARGEAEEERGRAALASSYQQRAAEVAGQAGVLREVLAKLPD